MSSLRRPPPLAIVSGLVVVLGACVPTAGTPTAASPVAATARQPLTVVRDNRVTAELERCQRENSTFQVRCTVRFTSRIQAEALRVWTFSPANILAVDLRGIDYSPRTIETDKPYSPERLRGTTTTLPPGIKPDNRQPAVADGGVMLALGYRDTGKVELSFDVPNAVREFASLTLGSTEFRHIAF